MDASGPTTTIFQFSMADVHSCVGCLTVSVLRPDSSARPIRGGRSTRDVRPTWKVPARQEQQTQRGSEQKPDQRQLSTRPIF